MIDALDFESNADAAPFYTSLGIAILPSHHPAPLPGRSQHGRHLYACSCKNPDCARPACHPIGALTIEHATVNPDRVAAWWAASPDANVLTPSATCSTSSSFAARFRPSMWPRGLPPTASTQPRSSTAHPEAFSSPSVRAEPATARHAPLSRGGVLRHAPESFILLPPSKRIDGDVTTWLRPFDERTVMLPDGEELFSALSQLPGDRELHAWSHNQEPETDGQLSGTRP
jgi:hypothetical protein